MASSSSIREFQPGEVLFVEFLVPETTEPAKVWWEGGYSDGFFRPLITFDSPAVVVMEGVRQSRNGGAHSAFHLRFVREAREDGEVSLRPVTMWPRLRAALKHAQAPRLHFAGGFREIPLYCDEIAVADFSMSGSWGWIVPRADIGKLLAALPPR